MVEVLSEIKPYDGAQRVFQSYPWIAAAWQHLLSKELGNVLWITRWFQEKSSASVLFLGFIDRRGCLRLINDTHSDMGGCVVTSGANVHYAFKEIAAAIQNDPRIKSVWLQKIPGDESVINALGVFLKGSVIYRDNAYSLVESGQCEDFIVAQSQLKSKDKADLKAIRRKVDKDCKLDILEGGKDEYPSDIVKSLVEQMKRENRSDAFFPSGMLEFTKDIFAAGIADIIILRRNGEVIALNFLLKQNGDYLSWIFLYTDARASSMMYVKYLTERAKKSSFSFNFGVGVYDYKIGSFRPNTKLTFSLRYHKSFLGKFADLISANLRMAKDIVKSRRG